MIRSALNLNGFEAYGRHGRPSGSREGDKNMSKSKTLAGLNDFVDWFIPPAIAADREVRP